MTNDLLIALQMWVLEAGQSRHVCIEMGESMNPSFEKIWVYDYNYQEGLHIQTIEDLENMDLKEKHKERIKQAYLKSLEEV